MFQQKAALKTAGLVIVLGLLIAGGILSRVKAVRDPILTFNPPGCVLPCVLGVTPGETDFNNAMALMQSNPQLREINDFTFEIEDQHEYPIWVILKRESLSTGNNIGMIEIDGEPDNPITTLGALIGKYGNPEQTFRGRVAGPNAVSLLTTFENGSILAIISAMDQVDPNSPITYLGIIAPNDKAVLQGRLSDVRLMEHFDDEVTWLGYTSIGEYWEQ